MKKQARNQIFKSVLLLLSVLLMIAGATVGTLAASSETRTLELTLDENVEKCTISIANANTGEWELYETVTQSGTVTIPYDSKVLLTIVPVTGKWPEITWNKYGSIAVEKLPTIQWSAFKDDVSISVACVERVYTIHALNYNRKDEIPDYRTVAGSKWSISQLIDGSSVTYQYGAEPWTELPIVEMEDYTFKGWNIKMGEGQDDTTPITPVDGKYYIPHDLTRTKYFDNMGGIIYVYPEMEPVQYTVYREDRVFDSTVSENRGELLFGAIQQQAPVKFDLSAMDKSFWEDDRILGDFKSYKGYRLVTDYNYPTQKVGQPPENNPHYNTVYRFYEPIKYTLKYDLNDNGDSTTIFYGPSEYTYATTTVIGIPARTGYTFVKWNVQVYDAVLGEWKSAPALSGEGCALGDKKATYDATTRNDPNAVYASDAQDNGAYEIRLTAEWRANEYDITYQWGEGVAADLIQNKAELPATFTFDAICFIPNPVRPGYTFTGWTLTYEDGTTPPAHGLELVEGGYNLNGALHAQKVVLTASWQVKTYNVILSAPDATSNNFTASISGVQYDAALVIPDGFVVPTRTGYTFVGYYDVNGNKKYINADGTAVEGLWDLDSADGTVTLVAKWEINSYEVIIEPLQKVPAGVEITIIEVATGKEHPYTGDPISLPYQTEFKVKIVLPEGFKIIEWNGVRFETDDIHDGKTFISDTIQLGAEPISLRAEACPAKPEIGAGEDIQSILIDSDTSIKVNFADPNVASRYEVAISTNPNDANLTAADWQQIIAGNSYYLFTQLASGEELTPGTVYYVFIRLRETESTNSGLPVMKEARTRYDAFVNQTIQDLNDMFVEGDGDITKAVIQETVEKIEALRNTDPLPDDFYEQIQALVNELEAKLAFARFQDAKIAALEAFLEDCFQSGSFNTANKALLSSLCQGAVADISAATTTEDVEAIFAAAMTAMKAVPVSYLYDATGSIQLTTLLGLSQNGGLSLSSVEDIQALRRAISDAIAQGKITADSFITIEQAKELLRVLDTVGAYNFYLINVQPAQGDTFEFRMLIPEALAGRTGLQVVYYNAATGMVELLETTVEGNVLIFRAKQVADFAIMADPTVDLTGVIIALGVIVLCQLIAIILVLAARSKAKNAIKHASVALPMFLTIYFQPANSEMIALGLGALALILQIVLMWLLISSGMIRVRKAKKPAPTRQPKPAPAPRKQTLQSEATTVPAKETQSSMGSFVIEEDTEEEYAEDEQMLGEDVFDEALADELAREQAEEEFPAEEVYDDEEFIEHAPNPYYSLDDEEDVYAYNQEETERVSDVDTTGQETQETSYGADPIDGVFGEEYVQDGYSGDEGGDSYYAESDAGAYDYADEADAAQFDSEILEGEETGDEGSVDPTAYIVNDNEEYSEEEEMYRYDE